MRIRVDDLQGPEVADLLRAHLDHSRNSALLRGHGRLTDRAMMKECR
jgi:hypothetical protein